MTDRFDNKPDGDDQAYSFASQFSNDAQAATSRAKHESDSMAARVTEVTTLFGRNIRELGGLIREHAPQNIRSQSEPIARSLQRAGTYLEEKTFDGIAEDVAQVIRKYPMQCLIAGVIIGVLLTRGRDSD